MAICQRPSASQYGSLSDGRWRLSLPYLSYSSPLNAPESRRLFGDANSDGIVDSNDFARFGNVLGISAASADRDAFDYYADGDIDAVDFAIFGTRFGMTL